MELAVCILCGTQIPDQTGGLTVEKFNNKNICWERMFCSQRCDDIDTANEKAVNNYDPVKDNWPSAWDDYARSLDRQNEEFQVQLEFMRNEGN